jgi:predicted ATPase
MLKKLSLLRDKVEDWNAYPLCVPVIRNLDTVSLTSRICFFAGENGSGKSTLLEAIAAHYGFGPEGGARNFLNSSTDSNYSTDNLRAALRLSFDKRTGAGYYLRAESFFNTDEPEAALSPQRQLAFLVLLHDTLRKHKDAQFIISSHSPLLLGYPQAQILSFDGGKIHEIGYEDLPCVQIARRFLNHRENFLQQLLNDPPRLFPHEG